MDILGYILLFTFIAIVIYDRYIQRTHQILINYPLIGRMRYFLEAVREPFRQYFADENFYDSKDKIDWVYGASYNRNSFVSFSPNQPQKLPKWLLKHSNSPLNNDEVDETFSVTFGVKHKYPFVTQSIISRSAMSDGAISPEGTRAFSKGAYNGRFPINTGEGGLTTNFFFTHTPTDCNFLEIIKLNNIDKKLFKLIKFFTNSYIAITYFRNKYIPKDLGDTFLYDKNQQMFFRINWNAPLDKFPKEIPSDIPDIIFQMGSGLYGVRDQNGNFDEEKYKKVMSFSKMTEIKLAQGAKQTGGKLVASKVTPTIAYFRDVEANKNLYSPNRFPYAKKVSDLHDFVKKLQDLSQKPVGYKLVISSRENFEEYLKDIKYRKDNHLDGIPDFITVDGGDGGSATAPIFLMDTVGFNIKDSIFIAKESLKEYGLEKDIKLIASSKILTPDDVVTTLALGADFISIGRGFMLSAGCIRARMCSGQGSHQCPVGLATQDKKLRHSYLTLKQAQKISNYHNVLIDGIKTVLAVMGKTSTKQLSKEDLTFIDRNGFIHTNINEFYTKKVKDS